MPTLPFRRRPLIEELEPRLLFSADLAPLALDTMPPAPEQRLLDSNDRFTAQTATVRHELVVVDAGVVDYTTLLNDILKQADAHRQIEVVVLDSAHDGIAQLSGLLKSYEQLDALHVIAHGTAGELQLGNQRIDTASLDARASEIAAWQQAFSAEADLLLYGCDIASSPAGEQWIASLSQLTGADVAASTDLTGNPAQQGDWNLEAQTGTIETPLLLGSAQTVWQGTLNINPASSQTLANETTPNQQTTTPSSRQVAINPIDGSFVVVWTAQDGGANGVYLRQFNADGSPKPAGDILVNSTTSNDQETPDIAMNASGEFVVVWQSQSSGGNGIDIYGQRFNPNATPNGAEFRINTTTSSNQTSPSVAIDGSGGFVVAWESSDTNGSGIYAQRFDSLGNKIQTAGQDQFRVNSETNRNQTQPAVAMNSTGAFVIVWTSERQDVDLFDNESDGVYGRLFDATGSTVNAEFRVNWAAGGNQTTPDVAMNDTGAFVVVLADDISASNPNIDAFMFNSVGTRQGLGTLVTSTTGLQNNPTVDIRSTGDFLVTWESENQDGSAYGIAARHFKSDYTPYANEQIINIDTSGDQLAPSVAWNGQQAVFVWSGNGTADAQGVYFRQAEINTPPVITSNGGGGNATVSVPENTTVVTTVTATDIDNHAPSFSLSGGADASKFTIDTTTGVLSFLAPPNFEAPTDTNSDNTYQVTVRVSDGYGGSDTQTLSVKVTNGSDAPTLTDDVYSTNQLLPFSIAAPGLLQNDLGPDNVGLSVAAYTQPSLGSVAVNPDGGFIYTPDLLVAGQTSFTYTATNGVGLSSTATVYINVTLLNSAPTTSNVNLGNLDEDSIRLITRTQLLANANDPDGDNLSIVNLAIASGGGTLVSSGSDVWTYTPASNATGAVSFSYRVSDGSQDAAGDASLTLIPVNDAPVVASPIPNQSATEDAPYSFTFAPTVFSDVDTGDTLTYTAIGLPAWLTFDAGTRTFSGAPGNSDVGSTTITLRATDTASESVETTFNFTVVNVNDAPTITSDGGTTTANLTVVENTTSVTTLTATDPDTPTQTLSYAIVGGVDAAQFSIDSATGALSFIAAPDYETPTDFDGNRVYELVVEARDGAGGTDSQILAITLANANEASTAQNDFYMLDQDGTLVVPAPIGVLSNDTDPENDTLSVSNIVSWLSYGTGTLNTATGAFNYTPNAGFTGQDSFSYEITDGQGHTATATVILNVNPVNHAPTTSAVVLAPLAEDNTRLLTQSMLLAGASDPDGDPLIASGLVISSGSGSLVDHGNGSWTYTPTSNDDTSVSFSYTVSDGSLGTSGSATLDITPVNDAPIVASAIADQTATEDVAYSFQIPVATFADAEGNALTYSVTSSLPGWLMFNTSTRTFSGTPGNGDVATSLITVRATDSSGAYVEDVFALTVAAVNDAPTTTGSSAVTVDEDAADTVIDLFAVFADIDDATLTYTLRSNTNPALFSATPIDGIAGTMTLDYAPDAYGTATLVVRATDGGGLWVERSISVTVNPVNDVPVAANATHNTSEDMPLAGSLPAATDADGDTVTYSLNSAASNGMATVNADGSFSYTPNAHFNGNDSFSYRIDDGQGGNNSYTVNLTIASVNDAPSLSANPLSVAQGQTVTVSNANLLATDVDHAAAQLSFVLTSAPTAGTLALNGTPLATNDTFTQADLDAGRVTYTQTTTTGATDSLSLTVFDPASAQASGVLAIAIAVPAPPVEAAAPMAPTESAPPTSSPVAEPDAPEPVAPEPAASLPVSPPESRVPEETVSLVPVETSPVYTGAPGSGNAQTMPNSIFGQALSSTPLPTEPTLLSALDNVLKAMAAHDASTLENLQLSLGSEAFRQQLNQLQNTLQQQLSLDKNTVASSLAVSTGLSIGYVLWLVRGGVLLSSLLSTLPAWRLIDPLPILGTLKRRDEQDDDDSLEGLLKQPEADAEAKLDGEKND